MYLGAFPDTCLEKALELDACLLFSGMDSLAMSGLSFMAVPPLGGTGNMQDIFFGLSYCGVF